MKDNIVIEKLPRPAERFQEWNWKSDDVAGRKLGDVETKLVAVCKTDRVCHDPIAFYVLLPCKVSLCGDGQNTRWAVQCPRYPQGIHPGVWAGVPVLAARDMYPMKKA